MLNIWLRRTYSQYVIEIKIQEKPPTSSVKTRFLNINREQVDGSFFPSQSAIKLYSLLEHASFHNPISENNNSFIGRRSVKGLSAACYSCTKLTIFFEIKMHKKLNLSEQADLNRLL